MPNLIQKEYRSTIARPEKGTGKREVQEILLLDTINLVATIGPCGPRPRPPAGGVPVPDLAQAKRYAFCVTGPTVIIFAPANVATVSTTLLSGEF
jgi:hypothetical protein